LSSRKFLSRKFAGVAGLLSLLATLGVLGGCSPGAGIEGTPAAPTGTSSGSSTPSGTTAVPTLTLALTDATGANANFISVDAPATVTATLKDPAGLFVTNAVVTFSVDSTSVLVSPAETALTDGKGAATVTLKPIFSATVGAHTITASAEVGGTEVSATANFAIQSKGTGATLALALTDAAGAAVTSISIGAPATVRATVKDANGSPVPNTVVTFSTDETLATITPAPTALTDASGVATVTLNPATISTAGATTITAEAQVGTAAVTGSIGYAVGIASVTVAAPVLGVGSAPLSAFGTTSVSVAVSLGGVPVSTTQNVTFSSSCASVGKAVLSSGVATVDGTATGSYTDKGCAGTDSITATAAGVTSAATSLVVTPPATGSIQFVSATPEFVALKGIGGTEAAQVIFKVLDAAGNPISGKTVTFELTTTVGGITLTPAAPATAVSDSGGLVKIGVNSGTVSTPVRVTASTPGAIPGATLSTQSSALTITTGIPDQDSFSLGATVLNPEFLEVDGNTTVLTVRLGDHFNNPVPNGTAVNFTTEGGSIVGSCSTVIDGSGNSNCSVTLTSQAPRLAPDGRYTVLAYALGEESFIDLNGNGVVDLVPDELVDQNKGSTDMPEAFLDSNENGVWDADPEPFIDLNQNGIWDGPDGQYSGVLCDNITPPPAGSSVGTCAARKSIHVRGSTVIIFSGSHAVISKISPEAITLPLTCLGESTQVDLRIVDVNGNPMPAGTKIEFKTSIGEMSGASSFVQDNTNVTPPASAANYTVFVRDTSRYVTVATDPTTGVETQECDNGISSGALTLTVTTPGGTVTTAQYPIN